MWFDESARVLFLRAASDRNHPRHVDGVLNIVIEHLAHALAEVDLTLTAILVFITHGFVIVG